MMPPGPVFRNAVVLLVSVWAAAGAAPSSALDPAAGRPLAIVTPGTVVGDRAAPRWNRLILASTPRIAAGDADSIPGVFRDRIDRFTLVLLATVRPVAGPDGTTRQVLEELGAGFAVPLAGRLTVVDTDNPPAAAGIDFIGRQLLAQNGKSLVGLTCVGGSDTIQIFDAESILFRDGKHRDFVMRHFVWVDPGSGECSFCVWLLEARPDGALQAAADPPRWVPAGTREDRAMHVDAREFLLGIPTRRAFALLDMPPGRQLQWSPALKEAAAAQAWPPAAVQALAGEINRGLAPLRAAAPGK